jgi:hypothetical protein
MNSQPPRRIVTAGNLRRPCDPVPRARSHPPVSSLSNRPVSNGTLNDASSTLVCTHQYLKGANVRGYLRHFARSTTEQRLITGRAAQNWRISGSFVVLFRGPGLLFQRVGIVVARPHPLEPRIFEMFPVPSFTGNKIARPVLKLSVLIWRRWRITLLPLYFIFHQRLLLSHNAIMLIIS